MLSHIHQKSVASGFLICRMGMLTVCYTMREYEWFLIQLLILQTKKLRPRGRN